MERPQNWFLAPVYVQQRKSNEGNLSSPLGGDVYNLGRFDPIDIINKWSQVAEQHRQQQEDAQQDSLLYTYYTDKNHALPPSMAFVPGSYGLWSNAPVKGPKQFPGTLSGCLGQIGRAPVGPVVVKCHLIINITIVITIVVMRENEKLFTVIVASRTSRHQIIQSQFQTENIPSFTCGGFSESSAGYLSSRKTLESCKSRSISQGQRSTLNQKIRGYGQTSDVILVEPNIIDQQVHQLENATGVNNFHLLCPPVVSTHLTEIVKSTQVLSACSDRPQTGI